MPGILPAAVRQRRLVRRVVKLIVAILLAAIAADVYHAFVFSTFEPIRLDVVGERLHASRRIVTITLPDLSALRGQTAVISVRLQNTLLQQRQIGLARDGFPRDHVVLPPHRTIRWDIVLPPELLRALDLEVGDGARALELTGDADGWSLTALEIRNYHVRVGNRPTLVVLPRDADAYTTGTRFVPVAIALCLLALLNVLAPKSERRSFRLTANGLALTAFVVCLICLLLPTLSAYKVLLSPSAFWLIAAGLFSPGLLHAASALVVTMSSPLRRCAAATGTIWKRHEVTFERAAALLGLAAIAIAQPIFEVVSNSPEFFAARGTTAATAVAAVLAICFGVPCGLLAIERAMRMVSPSAAATFYGVTLAVLSAAVVMPWLRQIEVLMSPWDGMIGGLVGAVVALANARSHIVRQFLTALAPAALAVPTLLLVDPGVKQSLLPSEPVAPVQTIERTPPIVFVIFDELPLNSLLTAEGTIDAGRYPNFAALAQETYWFRNASTVASNTSHAVPAILSGRYPTAVNDVPTLQYYPVNLFTTLAPHYEIFASFRFQKLCPPRACHDNSASSADTARSLLSDLGLVWLHIVLPQTLTATLPPVTDDWAEFGRAGARRTEEIRDGRDGAFAQFVSAIDGQRARVHFIHSMLPHMAFEYVPSGRRYRGPDHETLIYRRSRLFERSGAAFADTLHQRHLAQVGFVDRLLGDLIRRLREVGVYDKALVIITADHGASYREGRSRREPQPERNLSDILRVPLLMKLPGQRRGEVVDRIVETVDILPTILDVIGAKASLRFDGRSLIDQRLPERSSRTFIWRNRLNVTVRTVEDLSAQRAASLDRKEHRFGRGDLAGLYAPPGARRFLGMSRPVLKSAPDVRIAIRNRTQFRAVNLARDPLPLYVTGVLDTSRSAPLTVAVIVNGSVAAVTHSYRERGAHMFGTLVPETSLRDGNNTVAALVIDGQPAP
jgi:Sulfatase